MSRAFMRSRSSTYASTASWWDWGGSGGEGDSGCAQRSVPGGVGKDWAGGSAGGWVDGRRFQKERIDVYQRVGGGERGFGLSIRLFIWAHL